MRVGLRPLSTARAVTGLMLVFVAASVFTNAAAGAPGQPAKGVRVAGVCKDEGGQPVSGVAITLYRENKEGKAEKLGTWETKADGKFEFVDVPASTDERLLGLTFTKREHGSIVRDIYPQPGDVTINVEIRPAATLQGRVTEAAGNPIAEVRVWFHKLRSGPIAGISSAVTDADGKYAITDMGRTSDADLVPRPIGGGRVQAGPSFVFFDVRHPDFAYERPTWSRIPATVDVVLQKGGVIEGKVTDQVTGKPAVEATVSLQGLKGLANFDQVRTNATGKYQIRCLKAGRYNLWADTNDRACAAIDSLQVTAGKTLSGQDLTLVEGGWIEGRVVDATTGEAVVSTPDRRPYIGCHGPARPKSGAAVQSIQADENGKFKLRVPPGLNFPYIMNPNFWKRTDGQPEFDNGIEVKSGKSTELIIRVDGK